MAVTRSNRTSSPTPSDSSDALWESFDDYTSPTPSQTADPLGWDSNASQVSINTDGATPTPQTARPSTPPSIDEFPPLTPTPTAVMKPLAKAKAKGKKKAVEEPGNSLHTQPSLFLIQCTVRDDEDDPTLVADIEKAKAESLAKPAKGKGKKKAVSERGETPV
jgi:hypothetical protein